MRLNKLRPGGVLIRFKFVVREEMEGEVWFVEGVIISEWRRGGFVPDILFLSWKLRTGLGLK
jgi:hypothetical protein